MKCSSILHILLLFSASPSLKSMFSWAWKSSFASMLIMFQNLSKHLNIRQFKHCNRWQIQQIQNTWLTACLDEHMWS